jgi:hypothetical protein
MGELKEGSATSHGFGSSQAHYVGGRQEKDCGGATSKMGEAEASSRTET